jgi:hypothetical protein
LSAAETADDDWLQQAYFDDGCGELVERILVEGAARLPRIGRDGADSDFLKVRSGDLA